MTLPVMTAEEARAMWAEKYGTRERTADAGDRGAGSREQLAGIRERLGAIRADLAKAVEAGKITEEEAKARWDAAFYGWLSSNISRM